MKKISLVQPRFPRIKQPIEDQQPKAITSPNDLQNPRRNPIKYPLELE